MNKVERAFQFREDAMRALRRARIMKAEGKTENLATQVAIARLKWHFYLDAQDASLN